MENLEVKHASIHGHDLAFRAAGSGPVMLLVHGMAGSSSTWLDVMPLFYPSRPAVLAGLDQCDA